MSKETSTWLNQNTLIGYTEKRGTAWHYRKDDQGAEPNHYEGPVPVADVTRRLFDWQPIEADVSGSYLVMGDEGPETRTVVDPTRKMIVRSDNAGVLGVVGSDYKVHGYTEWLLRNVEAMVDGDLSVGSAGLLRGGAQAWVQVEVEDTMTVADLEFRPFLLAATSLDGSMASVYKQAVTAVVCDNTLAAGLGERGPEFRVRHTSGSTFDVLSARDALKIVHSSGDAFAREVEALVAEKVDRPRFLRWVDAFSGLTKEKEAAGGRGLTLAQNRRAELIVLHDQDERVAPWAGTALGVLQAANTWHNHYQTVRGTTSRADRNTTRLLEGGVEKMDQAALRILATV